jgi:hypothetical protein
MVNALHPRQTLDQRRNGHKLILKVALHHQLVTARRQQEDHMVLKACLKTDDLALHRLKCKTAGIVPLVQTDLERHTGRLPTAALWEGNQSLVKQCDEILWIVTGVK